MNRIIFAVLVLSALAFNAYAQSPASLLEIQKQWAHINYVLEGDEQVDAFEALIKQTQQYVSSNPGDADSLIWLGIIQSSTAGAKGGLGALSFAKAAKKSFEQAMKMDETALDGSAMTSLGVLYHKVPGWPISFGSDKKANMLLTQALKINPKGIDPNYFYAEYLFDEGQYQEAKTHLLIAQSAPPRPQRPVADAGRHGEIEALLKKVESKL